MPTVSYRLASCVCAAAFMAIAFTLVMTPGWIYTLFALAPTETGDVLAKRAAILFAGLTFLLLVTSGHGSSETRTAIAMSVALTLVGLLLLGMMEWCRNTVGHGIWLAIGAELALAVLVLGSDRAERRAGPRIAILRGRAS